MKPLLYLPGKLYEFGVRFRMALYEAGYLQPQALQTPVISIGNLTLGGTGKTPLTAFVAGYLIDEGFEVGILTRGYARSDTRQARVLVSDGTQVRATLAESGDEPWMLARQVPQAKILVGKHRFRNGQWLEQHSPCDVFLLDDGYQHFQLKRDLNILVLDATDPFGGGEMVPFGRLREPLYALKRADVILVTRADRPFDQDELEAILAACEVTAPVIYTYHDVTGLHELGTNRPQAQRLLSGKRVGVVCALGNPAVFVEDVTRMGAQLVYQKTGRDHHAYTQGDVQQIVTEALAAQAEILVTTEKDAVKLEAFDFVGMPVSVLEIKARIDDEVQLKSLLLRAIVQKRRKKD